MFIPFPDARYEFFREMSKMTLHEESCSTSSD